MSLSTQDLLNIQKVPEPHEMSLQTLSIFYEEHLCHRQFIYELKHKQQELRLRFKPGDLCHLLGIHHIIKGSEYSGERGFKAMQEGRLTFEFLKQANIGAYEDKLYRMLYFPFVYQLIQNPRIVIENQQHSTSIINAQFIFYDGYGERYIELKLRRESKNTPNFFVPVSFGDVRKVKARAHVAIKEIYVSEYNDGYKS